MSLPSFATIDDMVARLKPSYPVYCLHPQVLREAVGDFLQRFPGDVMYAVKCNPHNEILQHVYAAGVRHFDTASLNEIAQISELFPDTTCYYMHPVKPRAAIRSAHDVYNVEHFVVDHEDELQKVLDETHGANIGVFVRMATPPGGATYELSRKFGARPDEVVRLLGILERNGLRRGLAFHVGSQCTRINAYEVALDLVEQVLTAAGEIDWLDVGGGFPGHYENTVAPPLEAFLDAIGARAARLPLPARCRLMCEPGRAIVANSMSLVVQVQLRKSNQIYINDGIYGSLSEAAVARVRYPARLLRLDRSVAEETAEFTVNGPTCDSLDVLPDPLRLPVDVREGDWIEIGRIGAYSNANATRFNGLYPEAMVSIGPAPYREAAA